MPASTFPTIRLDGSADLASVDALLDELDRLWELAPGIGDEDRLLFGLAVSEIATNIAEYSPAATRVSAVVSASSDALRAEIRDTAPPADIEVTGVMPDADAESGRGLPLAATVLDEFHHEVVSAGNAWTLVRILHLAAGESDEFL